MHTITLLWAEKPDPGDEATTYTFATEAEYKAFMLGVEAATGWINVRQVPEGFIVPDGGWTDDLADTYPDMF